MNAQELIKSEFLATVESHPNKKLGEHRSNSIWVDCHLPEEINRKLEFHDSSLSLIYLVNEDTILTELEVLLSAKTQLSNPQILKGLKVTFETDDTHIECITQNRHEYRQPDDELLTFYETAAVILSLEQLIKLVYSSQVRLHIVGSQGVLVDKTLDDYQLDYLKGFYNAVFDSSFEVDFLVDSIKKYRAILESIKQSDEDQKSVPEPNSKSDPRCFVVTATMGDVNHPVVQDFRTFRDEKLVKNSVGVHLISIYSAVGPFLAEIIHKHDFLRKAVFFCLLAPLHRIIKCRQD